MGEELSDNVKLHLKVGALVTEMKNTNKNMERIYETVYGDGNGGKGLVIKTDRLEQVHKQQKWVTRVIAVPVIGWVVQLFIDLFKH